MSFGPLNAEYLKNGDVINIASAFSNYSTNKQYDVMTVNTDDVCGPSSSSGNTNLSYCMACGKCSSHGATTISYDVGNSAQSSSTTNFTIAKVTLPTGDKQGTFNIINSKDPIFFGDLVVFYITIGGTQYAWQTGPALAPGAFNDTVALQPLDPSNKSKNAYYQVWTIVNPAGAQGINDPNSPNYNGNITKDAVKLGINTISNLLKGSNPVSSVIPSTQSPYYGNPYWIQSFGKAAESNKNYQYVTLNNSGYDCIVSTQDVTKTPNNRGPMFIFTNGQGNIPLTNGRTANVPRAGDHVNSGLFGLHIFSTISEFVSIAIYLTIYFILTIVFLILVYYLI